MNSVKNFLKIDIKSIILGDLYFLIFIPFLFSITIPFFMISSSPEDFSFLHLVIIFETALIEVVIIIPFLTFLKKISDKYNYVKLFIYLIFYWLIFTGLLFPLVGESSMKNIDEMILDKKNLIIASILSILCSILTFTKINPFLRVLFLFFLISTSITSILSMGGLFQINNTNEKLNKFFKLSSKNNVIVMGFDGIPNIIIKKVILENKIYYNAFKDFIFFDNIVAQAPYTTAALRSELFGNQDYHKLGNTHKQVLSKLDLKNSIINQYEDSFTYGAYGIFKEGKNKIFLGEMSKSKNIEEHIFFSNIKNVRIFTPIGSEIIRKLKIYNILFYLNEDNGIKEGVLNENNKIGTNWKTNQIKDVIYYKSLLDKIKPNDKDISIRFYHFTFSHFPVDFDENCTFRSTDLNWFQNNQNEIGLENEVKCSVSLMIDFLNKLKEKNLYDNSLIIFKSDHGEPPYFFSTEPENFLINGHPMFGYNRYRPFFMIKRMNTDQKELQFSEKLTSLSNLSKTLCTIEPIKRENCSAYPGFNMLDNPNAPDEIIHVEIPKSPSSMHVDFNSFLTLSFKPESNDFFQTLKSKNSLNLKNGSPENIFPFTSIRISDLTKVNSTLAQYHQKYGEYPKTEKWDGHISYFGKSKDPWIDGLTPEFLDTLPIDPKDNGKDGNQQYIYKSDGKDYKLIFHSSLEECNTIIKKENPELIDPARNCWAYGYWSKGAEKW
jgi:hypothetical protein